MPGPIYPFIEEDYGKLPDPTVALFAKLSRRPWWKTGIGGVAGGGGGVAGSGGNGVGGGKGYSPHDGVGGTGPSGGVGHPFVPKHRFGYDPLPIVVAPAGITRTALNTGSASSGDITVSLTLASGDLLVVGASNGTGPSTITATWNSLSLTEDKHVSDGITISGSIFSLKIATGATANLVASFTGGGSRAIWASKVTGLATGAIDKTAGATGNSNAPSSGATATTTVANEIVFGSVSENSAANQGSWSNSFNNGQFVGPPSLGISEGYLVVSSTAAYTAAKTGGSSLIWSAICATYK